VSGAAGVPPRRVLFVHQSADLYGSDRVLLDIVRALVQAGGEAIVALPAEGPLVGELRRGGAEVHRLGDDGVLKLSRAALSAGGLLRLAAALPRVLRALDRCVAGRRVDLVHSNTLAVLAGAWWARWRRVPHVWHVHEIVERPRLAARALPWLVSRAATAVACNSQATHGWLSAAQPALVGRSRVVWNGVAAAGTQPVGEVAELAHEFRPAGTRVAVGLVGRINRMKGQLLLLEAAELLYARGVDGFSIVFVGSTPVGQEEHLDRLRERIVASPLRERVVERGFLYDLGAAYAALDMVCVPSTEAEAFGLVAVEAMAASLPVVAARIGGLPEIVLHGQTGLLHAPGDAAALADALQPLIADTQLRSTYGSAGRLRYEREFTTGVMCDRMLALMKDVAA
jgi:glycosyltransferase involved in cell wall biosynthesis